MLRFLHLGLETAQHFGRNHQKTRSVIGEPSRKRLTLEKRTIALGNRWAGKFNAFLHSLGQERKFRPIAATVS
jgi:hypothetical protein